MAQAARLWTPRNLSKGATVFAAGDETADVVVMLSGLVKLVYTNAQGEDWIKSFIIDQGVFSARGATSAQQGETYSAECLEPTEFVRLPRAFVETSMSQSPELRSAVQEFSEWVLSRKQMREAALLTMTPQARYLALLQTGSTMLSRLPQGDIARFIGITPIAFSRIKRRISTVHSAG
jgi:CRP-like cAMP-binding protein